MPRSRSGAGAGAGLRRGGWAGPAGPPPLAQPCPAGGRDGRRAGGAAAPEGARPPCGQLALAVTGAAAATPRQGTR